MILNFVEVLEWVNKPNFTHASSFRYSRWGKAIFLTFVNLASLSHDFLSAVDLAICGCWLCGFYFVDLSLTRGARRTDWFPGCCAALASWLLRLLLSFDYQNLCLLFLKLQVQDQNDYFGKLSEAYFQNSSHLCSWNFMLDCLDLSNQVLCADSVYLGFLFICDLVICNLNFSSVIWGFKQTPGNEC
jgi:hypothetical protein